MDVLRAADEGRENYVDVVFDAKQEIPLVLLRECRQIDVRLGQIDTLLGAKFAVVDGAHAHKVLACLEDLKRENAVVNVNHLAHLNHLGEVNVVDVHHVKI
ncbi:hypothetical protein BC937DRAFT_90053 [Endogone sp. FLAS-F59071]|nr:hypothetical protein BC937DRAFT_90053 [Endogone sp. FLAS-F59071]|eukprot:RUS22197.1 hypothetical protein BC937DRAFT_90053 [Endogone sp. FLAS-F59071]